MIRLFYGEDRVRTKQEIEHILGTEYEVVDGEEVTVNDLPSIFWGSSLFGERRILVKDLGVNKSVFAELGKYTDSQHQIILWESKLDKRTTAYKEIKEKILIKEFNLPKKMNTGVVFDVYQVAKRDGLKAVGMLEQIENEQDPFMFVGLMVSQAMKDFVVNGGTKEKRVLKELSKLDMNLKTSSLPSWTLVKSFLLRLSSW